MLLSYALKHKKDFTKNLLSKISTPLLSIVLSVALLFNSKAIAADTIVNNPVSQTYIINAITNSNDLVQITNSGTIYNRVNSGPISRSSIDLGNNASSFIDQVQGELLANITMNHDNQTFTYRSGTFEGNIIGGSGTNFNGQFLVNGNLRYYQEIRNVDQLTIASGVTLSLLNPSGADSLANNVTIGSGAELIVGDVTTIGSNNIDGSAANTGTLSIIGGGISNQQQNIGATNRLAQINIDSSSVLWTHGILNAATINVSDGSLFMARTSNIDSIILNGDSGLKFFLLDTSDAHIDVNANITATNSSNTADIHIMNLFSNNTKTVKFNGNIGTSSTPIAFGFVDGNVIADFSDAAQVNIGRIALYTINQHEPTILLGSGNFNSQIVLFDNSNSVGAVRIVADHNLNSSIGAANARVNNLEINSNTDLTVANSIYVNSITNNSGSTFAVSANNSGFLNTVNATNFTNYGYVDLSAASGQLVTNITNHSGSSFDIGANAIIVDGTANFSSGSTFSVDLVNPNQFGSMRSNILQIENGVLLNVNIQNAHDFYNLQSSSYTVAESVDKDNSSVSAIGNQNIRINSQSTNQIGLLTITTSSTNDNLILNVIKNNDSTSYNSNQAAVKTIVDTIGSDSSSQLLALQNYLTLTASSDEERRNAINSLLPTSASAVSRNSVHISNSIFRSIYSRISSYKISQVIGDYKRYKTVDSLGRDAKEADKSSTAQSSLVYGNDFQYEEDLSRNVWVQLIGSRAKQDDEEGFDGYKSESQGLVIGIDKKTDKSTLVGLSFAAANSEIDSSDSLTSTQSDIYQLSAYLEKEINKNTYYNLIAAVAKSTNNSSRNIPVASSTAKAKFNSYNYTAKGSLYHKILFGNGFDIVPELGLRYSMNQVDNYQEQGAGSLNLNVKTNNLQMLSSEIAVATGLKRKVDSMNLLFTKTGSFIIYPKIKLSYAYDFLQQIQTSVSNFEGHDLTFTTKSTRTDPSTIRLSIGSEIFGSEALSFNVKYIQERRSAYISHSGVLETRIAF